MQLKDTSKEHVHKSAKSDAGSEPDPAPRATALQGLLVNQSSVGGEVRDPDGCTLGEVQRVGQSVDTLLRCYTELSIASRLCGCGEHALSCLHITQNMDSLYIHQEPLTLLPQPSIQTHFLQVNRMLEHNDRPLNAFGPKPLQALIVIILF